MTITHLSGSYEVRFVSNLALLQDLEPETTFVVTDDHVAELLASELTAFPHVHRLSPGEASKSPANFLEIVDWLAGLSTPRTATLVALGGGVVGDLAGFAAASYMRGIRLVQIPTTLLAQVDSSVGGKTGVDLPQGKNLLGAFYPPQEVRVCVEMLNSLPERQVMNGMAEVLKYGFIMRPSILEVVPPLSSATLQELVQTCIECKKEVVEADEKEVSGRRAILNFGHTIGHALEAVLNYEELLHGEAISIGMVVESYLSEVIGVAHVGTTLLLKAKLAEFDLPLSHPALLEEDALFVAMQNDKKTTSEGLSFSLLTGIGSCELVKGVERAEVIHAINLALE